LGPRLSCSSHCTRWFAVFVATVLADVTSRVIVVARRHYHHHYAVVAVVPKILSTQLFAAQFIIGTQSKIGLVLPFLRPQLL
jgi:hypothetical protein